MNEWEAKYKALAAGITNKDYVDNAEKLVQHAINMSTATMFPFGEVFYSMLVATGLMQEVAERKRQKASVIIFQDGSLKNERRA